MASQKRVFVAMPFSKTAENHLVQYWARHFNSYLKPLIESVENLAAFRPDIPNGGVSEQTIIDLVTSDVVVADLTDHDSNVVWQLAVRQSFKNGAIAIAEMGTQVPANFSLKGVLFYDGEHMDNHGFEEKFRAALENCLNNPNDVDSPVLGALGGRGSIYSIIRNEENVRRINGLQLELSVNETLLGQIFDNCIKNKALRLANKAEAKKMTTTPLKKGATEFLLINRYLDMDKTFYSTVYAYHNYVDAINSHLVEWESTDADEEVEEWLLMCKDATYKQIAKLKEYLKQFK
jgi:hypothetical protein